MIEREGQEVGTITRPEVKFDGGAHTYHDGDNKRLWGISSVAKIGEAEDSFSIGSAWGFKLGYEGAYELLHSETDGEAWLSPEHLRSKLQAAGLTPWGVRDKAANRGNWAHDLLEALATDGSTAKAMEDVDEEYRGHGRAILQWFLDFRPSFVATEVQVTSVEHGFAGRYDIRCKIPVHKMRQFLDTSERLRDLDELDGGPDFLWALCLIDLKTSKRVYPTSHFVQLEGYELAGVEMGFPATDVRLVLNTHPDGTYDFKAGYATADDFLAYLEALKAIKGLKDKDPEVRRKRAMETAILALLPAISRDIAGQDGCPGTAQEVGRMLGGLRKRGLVEQDADKTWRQSS